MKRFILPIIVALSMLLFAVPAFALPMTLVDVTEFTASGTTPAEDYVDHGRYAVNKLNGFFDYVKYIHNYDFIQPVAEIYSATLTLALRDDEGDRSFWSREYASIWTEGGLWCLGEVDTGDYTYNIPVDTLLDGMFAVTLISAWGDFYIDSSTLTIDYSSTPTQAAAVPEPATILFMGMGLTGIAAVQRRRMKNDKKNS